MSLEYIDKEKQVQNQLAEKKLVAHSKFSLRNLLEKQSSLILSLLPYEATILEIGCGIGDLMVYIGKKSSKLHVMGIDPSDKAVELAKQRLKPFEKRLKVKTGAAETLTKDLKTELLTTSYNTAVMRGVVHHLSDIPKSFEEIFRALTQGGKIIILEGNAECPYRKFILGIADFLGIQHEASEFPHTPPSELTDILKRTGFKGIGLRHVSGIFAPFAYIGFGGKFFWTLANAVDSVFSRFLPRFFGWWFLMEAEVPDTHQSH